MAKKGAVAQKFARDLEAKTEGAFVRENRELQDYRRTIEGPAAAELPLGYCLLCREEAQVGL